MDTEQSNPQPEVYKVIGAPGTGKTTRVVGNEEIEDHTSLVQENMAEYDLDEQLIVTPRSLALETARPNIPVNGLSAPRFFWSKRCRNLFEPCLDPFFSFLLIRHGCQQRQP